MFRVGNTILSKSIATSRFACDLPRCKGACCVVGESGAPLGDEEVPLVEESARELRNELRPEARRVIDRAGAVREGGNNGYEIRCVGENECIFVDYTEDGIAECVIQRAWMRGDLSWEKPSSCHLYPIRLKKVGPYEYANFEYIPDLCSAGCRNGDREGIYLSEFLEKPLTRRYGEEWYGKFQRVCSKIRKEQE